MTLHFPVFTLNFFSYNLSSSCSQKKINKSQKVNNGCTIPIILREHVLDIHYTLEGVAACWPYVWAYMYDATYAMSGGGGGRKSSEPGMERGELGS